MKGTHVLALLAIGNKHRRAAAGVGLLYEVTTFARKYWHACIWFAVGLYLTVLIGSLWGFVVALPFLAVRQLWELRLTAQATLAASGEAGRREWARALRDAATAMGRDWWRLRRLHRRWAKACQSSAVNVTVKGGGAPELRRVRADGQDVRAVVHAGRVGIPVSALSKKAPELAEIMGARDLTVRPVRDRAELVFHFGDTLSRVYRVTDLPHVPRWDGESIPRLRYGLDSSGQPTAINLYTSVLIGGMSGSGKSSVIWSLLADGIRQGVPMRLRVVDPAGGVEFAELRRHLGYEGEEPRGFRVHRYIDNAKDAERLFTEMQAAMQARMRDMPEGVRQHYGTPEEPYDIALVDELLLVDSMRKKGSAAEDILTVGRKAGFLIIACTQDATVETVGPLRRLFPQRLCFATMNREATEVVLGAGAAQEAPAHRIPKHTPGVGYAYDEFTRGYTRFRAVHIPDAETRVIAKGQLPKSIPPAGNQRCAVYRHVGHNEFRCDVCGELHRLLYVGKALNPFDRNLDHEQQKPWWTDVMSVEIQWFGSEEAALAAEKRAIETEHPLHNIQHSRRVRRPKTGQAEAA